MASGVNLRKASYLEHKLLGEYFRKERWSRVLEVEAIALAAAGNGEAAGKALRHLTEILVPELGQDQSDFRDRAAKAMPAWDDQVLAIENDSRGRPSIRRYNVADVQEELQELSAWAEERIRNLDQGKKPSKGGRRKSAPPSPGSFQPRAK